MEAVPGGVEGLPGGIRNRAGAVFRHGGPPGRYVRDGGCARNGAAGVDPQGGEVAVDGCAGHVEAVELIQQPAVGLSDAATDVDRIERVGEGEGHPVGAAVAAETDDRCADGEFAVKQGLIPVGGEPAAGRSGERVPAVLDVDGGNQPAQRCRGERGGRVALQLHGDKGQAGQRIAVAQFALPFVGLNVKRDGPDGGIDGFQHETDSFRSKIGKWRPGASAHGAARYVSSGESAVPQARSSRKTGSHLRIFPFRRASGGPYNSIQKIQVK